MSSGWKVEKFDEKKKFHLKSSCERSFGSSWLRSSSGREAWRDVGSSVDVPGKKAYSVIRGCLANAALYSILEKRTPRGLWSKLQTMYIEKNMYNKLMLKKKLYSLRMREGGDVLGYIQKFDQMCNELLNIGVKMEEEDKSLLLLCSLPSSYDPLVMMLLYG